MCSAGTGLRGRGPNVRAQTSPTYGGDRRLAGFHARVASGHPRRGPNPRLFVLAAADPERRGTRAMAVDRSGTVGAQINVVRVLPGGGGQRPSDPRGHVDAEVGASLEKMYQAVVGCVLSLLFRELAVRKLAEDREVRESDP